MAVTFTLEASPPFPEGSAVQAFERRLWPGPVPSSEAPVVTPASTAIVTGGLAVFTELLEDRRYYAGAEVDGRWRWVSFTSGGQSEEDERLRAEAREAALFAELGEVSSVALPGGVVLTFGEPSSGQLGLGPVVGGGIKLKLVQIPTLAGVAKAVAGGEGNQLFMKTDGTVWHAGGSTFGNAGDGSAGESWPGLKPAPHQVALPEKAVDIESHGVPLVLTPTGRVLTWSSGAELCIGQEGGHWEPTYVEAGEGNILSGVKQICSGHSTSWYLMTDGSIRGAGIMDLQGRTVFAEVIPTVGAPGWNSTATVKEVRGGKSFVMCLLTDGTVRLKGRNQHGQMGVGTLDASNKPTKEWFNPGLTGVSKIATSEYNPYAIIGGKVFAWGRGNRGQNGNGAIDTEAAPTVTPEGGGAITARIDAGLGGSTGSTLTVTAGNANVRVGSVLTGTGVVAGQEVVAAIGANTWKVAKAQSLGLTSMNASPIYKVTWATVAGQSSYDVFWRTGPFNPSTGKAILYSNANSAQELPAATTSFTILGWGEPTLEVAVLGHADVLVPTEVPGLSNVVALSCGGVAEEGGGNFGDHYVLALLGDGTVKPWGGANTGNLGQGNAVTHPSPVTVPGVSAVIGVAAGDSHTSIVVPGTVTTPVSMTVTPLAESLLVNWTPEEHERITGWELRWRRIENNPSTGKPEGFQHDAESLKLPASAREHTIANLPASLTATWANPTNFIEVQLRALYAPALPTPAASRIAPHKWRVSWSEIPGPASAYDVTTGKTEAFAEPGWFVYTRLKPGETYTFQGEVPAGTTHMDIEGLPESGVEAKVEGSWVTLWGVRTVNALPLSMPAEVPWRLKNPTVKVETAYRKPKCNVVVIREPELSVTSAGASTWVVTWPNHQNAKLETEPGWVVRWRPNPNTEWAIAKVSSVIASTGGTQSFTIPESLAAKPEAQVYGTRAGVGDTLAAVPGEWVNATRTSPRTYQWYRRYAEEGVKLEPIAGATGATYQVQPVDVGYGIRVLERPTNAVGSPNILNRAGISPADWIGPPTHVVLGD